MVLPPDHKFYYFRSYLENSHSTHSGRYSSPRLCWITNWKIM